MPKKTRSSHSAKIKPPSFSFPSSYKVRVIQEEDVNQVATLYKKCYGEKYPYQDFYRPDWIKKGVYDDGLYWLVAVDSNENKIVASGAIVLEAGDHDDLLGEFGRMVVDPNLQKSGVGHAIAAQLLSIAGQRLEFGFAEARTAHLGSQKILEDNKFVPMGLEPVKYLLERRESTMFCGMLFGHARELRNARTLIIPEVEPLARHICTNLELPLDINVDDYAGRYPVAKNLSLLVMDGQFLPRLLRIDVSHVTTPEIFGGLHLSYGFFKISAQHAQYLVATNPDGKLLGAIGYLHDYIDEKVRIFEMVAHDDFVKSYLIDAVDAYITSSLGSKYIEVDVSAYSPRIQKTFWSLGYFPAVYAPAMVFQDTERLDIIRFVKVTTKKVLDGMKLTSGCEQVAKIVQQNF